MFSNQHEILFGDPHHIWKRDENGSETHVDRAMNVWGSGGAHSTYFKKIDEIVIEIFNKPLDEQPVGIADMGCGDGTLLEHLHGLVKNKTIRGENLEKYPLLIVGADFNQAARIASAKTLTDSRIQHHILHADISHPKKYATELKSQFNIELGDLLNVRSFLDHNRIYEAPRKILYKNINTSGSFSFKGKIITKKKLINNLIEHFKKWSPFIKKHGLILLELHTLDPKVTRKNIEKTLAPAYDATHGYSDQYLIEHAAFIQCLEQSNIKIQKEEQVLFPNNKRSTVSLNYMK